MVTQRTDGQLVLDFLRDKSKQGKVKDSLRSMAKTLEMSKTSLSRTLGTLEDEKLIDWNRGRGSQGSVISLLYYIPPYPPQPKTRDKKNLQAKKSPRFFGLDR